MNIIVLAAGMGLRLKEKTKAIPKCMVMVNGEKIIDRMMKNIEILNPETIVFVTGHLSELLENYIVEKWDDKFNIKFINNEIYDKTNNIYSLWLANQYMNTPFLLIESDIFFTKEIFNSIKFSTTNLWFADHFTEEMDGCMLTASGSEIKKIEIIRSKLDDYNTNQYKSVGILYIANQNKEIINLLEKEIKENNLNIYFDLFFAKNISEFTINVQNISPHKWFEIDNQDDLNKAEILFK
jgi:choline kinase